MEEEKERTEEEMNDEDKKAEEQSKKKSEKLMYISVILILIVIIGVISVAYIFPRYFHPREKTIDELIEDNLAGKLESEQGYLYSGYSFVFSNGLWYTQVAHPVTKATFNIPLHFGIREVKDIKTVGGYDGEIFSDEDSVYMTFDPIGQDLQYVALAISEIDQNLVSSFKKMPVAACAYNETDACEDRPIINCTNTDKPTIYVRSDDETGLFMAENCIIVQGRGMNIVKAADKLLLSWYGIN